MNLKTNLISCRQGFKQNKQGTSNPFFIHLTQKLSKPVGGFDERENVASHPSFLGLVDRFQNCDLIYV